MFGLSLVIENWKLRYGNVASAENHGGVSNSVLSSDYLIREHQIEDETSGHISVLTEIQIKQSEARVLPRPRACGGC